MVSQRQILRPPTSEEVAPAFLVFLPGSDEAGSAIAAELAGADIAAQRIGPGVRVDVGEIDWRNILERVAGGLQPVERRDTRVAIVGRGADERALRRALALAPSLDSVLLQYANSWVHELLQPGRLAIHFQPLVEYPPGKVYGYECLVRGIGPEGQLISPTRIFEAAGRVGVRYLVDRQACRAAMEGASAMGFGSLNFFVNIMAAGVERPAALAESSLAAVAAGGLRPNQVIFELTDSESICAARGASAGRQHLTGVIEALKSAGFGVSLDDLSPASPLLSLLTDIRADYVKFEGAASRRATASSQEGRLFAIACDTARRQGVIAIAKGIETEEELRTAIDAGAHLTQGFVHGRPDLTPLEAGTEDKVLRQVRRTAILAID